jgi:SSS family solute:Na+ symporter
MTTYPSEMAQNFWTAIWAFVVCFTLTVLVSLVSAPKADSDLRGLVYALTPKPAEAHERWFLRPAPLGVAILLLTLALNIVFW